MLFKPDKLRQFLAFHWSELLSWTHTCLSTTGTSPSHSTSIRPSSQISSTGQLETPTDLRSSTNVIIPLLFEKKIVLYLRAHILQSADILNQRLLKPSVEFPRATKRERAVLTYSLSLDADSKQQVCYTSHPAGTLQLRTLPSRPWLTARL